MSPPLQGGANYTVSQKKTRDYKIIVNRTLIDQVIV